MVASRFFPLSGIPCADDVQPFAGLLKDHRSEPSAHEVHAVQRTARSSTGWELDARANVVRQRPPHLVLHNDAVAAFNKEPSMSTALSYAIKSVSDMAYRACRRQQTCTAQRKG
jgi:hypothetical protein